MLEDRILIWQCRNGSEEALCRIYTKYKDFMLTLAKGMLIDHATAEDVVQDVFVRFAGSVKQFQLRGSLKGYLATCVSNRARDLMRAGKRRSRPADPIEPTGLEVGTPERSAMEREEIGQLRVALEQIPYEQREVVLLRLKGGMTFRKIAEHAGVSTSTVHGRYRYGLAKLKSLLMTGNSRQNLKEQKHAI